MIVQEWINRLFHRFVSPTDLYQLISEYDRSQYFPHEELEKLQLNKFKELSLFAKEHVRFYRKAFKDIDLENLSDLNSLDAFPILEKDQLRKSIEDFKPSDGAGISLRRNSTSGSSGKKLVFYTEANNYHTQAIRMRSEKWMGLGLFPKTYTIWGANWDVKLANRGFKNKLKAWLKNSVVLSGYNLRDSDIEEYLKMMRKVKVEKLVSYPSILFTLAKYSKEHNLPLRPKAIVSAGERLYDHQRALIEEVFNCKIFNFFASRDVPVIAQECEHGSMHIMSENVLVEVQTDLGEIKRAGEGDLIVTHFHNRATPFIRYRNGDRVSIAHEKCQCGRTLPVLKEVMGRTFEVIDFPNGNRVSGTFWTLISKSVPGIDEIEIIQKKDKSILFRFVAKREVDIDQLRKNIYKYSGESLILVFERVDEIGYGENGKQNFIRKE